MLNKFKNLSFTQQLTLPIVIIGFLVLGGLAALNAQESFDEAKKHNLASNLEVGQRYSLQLKSVLDKAFLQAQTMAETFLMESLDGSADRKRLILSLENLLKNEPQYLATWSAWEPNAYDGKDKEFANKEFHEESGRVYPWWVRQDNKITYKTLLNPETPDLGDWYFIPVREKRSVLVDPYAETVNGKMTLMTSAVYPAVHNNEVKAIFGIDISLETMSKIVSEVHPFADSKAYLLSDKNIIVAGPQQEELMKPFPMTAEVEKALSAHKLSSLNLDTPTGVEQFLIIPVQIFNTDYHWSLIIRTPESTILAEANQKLISHLVLSFLGLIALMGVVYFSAKRSESKIAAISNGLTGSAHTIFEEIRQLNTTGSQLAQGSTSAAASIEETAASLEEISSIVQLNSSNAQSASSLSAESLDLAKTGEQKISNLILTMDEIESSSRKIEEIINVIDDIAFQTNLLALNASVEAARAGEHGKGFAVVAEAVRSLAQRSAHSAKDISHLISNSVNQIRSSVVGARENGEILKKVSSSINKVAQINREIADASQQQSIGIQQISTAVAGLDQVIQKNASEAENIVTMASHIQESSEVMNDTVKVLKAS